MRKYAKGRPGGRGGPGRGRALKRRSPQAPVGEGLLPLQRPFLALAIHGNQLHRTAPNPVDIFQYLVGPLQVQAAAVGLVVVLEAEAAVRGHLGHVHLRGAVVELG